MRKGRDKKKEKRYDEVTKKREEGAERGKSFGEIKILYRSTNLISTQGKKPI